MHHPVAIHIKVRLFAKPGLCLQRFPVALCHLTVRKVITAVRASLKFMDIFQALSAHLQDTGADDRSSAQALKHSTSARLIARPLIAPRHGTCRPLGASSVRNAKLDPLFIERARTAREATELYREPNPLPREHTDDDDGAVEEIAANPFEVPYDILHNSRCRTGVPDSNQKIHLLQEDVARLKKNNDKFIRNIKRQNDVIEAQEKRIVSLETMLVALVDRIGKMEVAMDTREVCN